MPSAVSPSASADGATEYACYWKEDAMRKSLAVLALILWPSLGWADSNPWLTPGRPATYLMERPGAQYEILAYDLLHRAEFRRVAEQTFRQDALILDSDRDPLDVILRRTEALLSTSVACRSAPDLTAAAAARPISGS